MTYGTIQTPTLTKDDPLNPSASLTYFFKQHTSQNGFGVGICAILYVQAICRASRKSLHAHAKPPQVMQRSASTSTNSKTPPSEEDCKSSHTIFSKYTMFFSCDLYYCKVVWYVYIGANRKRLGTSLLAAHVPAVQALCEPNQLVKFFHSKTILHQMHDKTLLFLSF